VLGQLLVGANLWHITKKKKKKKKVLWTEEWAVQRNMVDEKKQITYIFHQILAIILIPRRSPGKSPPSLSMISRARVHPKGNGRPEKVATRVRVTSQEILAYLRRHAVKISDRQVSYPKRVTGENSKSSSREPFHQD